MVIPSLRQSLPKPLKAPSLHSTEQVNLIMANEITPHLTAEEYMDKGEYENELKQVIGDTKVAIRSSLQ